MDDLNNTLLSAQKLLGAQLIYDTPEGRVSGIIVETEAYTAEDAASHSFKGQTERNKMMFGPAGRAYIYFTYGMHYCFNVVTGPEGAGEAVLIRALEPLEGVEIMKRNRHREDILQLSNGPAKLVQALGISKNQNGIDLHKGELRIEGAGTISDSQTTQTTRIGIKQDIHRLWRFYIKDSPFISRR